MFVLQPTFLPSQSSSAIVSMSSPTNLPTSTPTSSGDASLTGGAIAGIAIGALAGMALLGSAIFFAMRAKKYKKVSQLRVADVHGGSTEPQEDYGSVERTNAKYAQQQMTGTMGIPGEMDGETHRFELQQPLSELPGSSGRVE